MTNKTTSFICVTAVILFCLCMICLVAWNNSPVAQALQTETATYFVENFKVNQRVSLHSVDDYYEVVIFKNIDPSIAEIAQPFVVTKVGRDYIVVENKIEQIFVPVYRIKNIIIKRVP